MKDQEDITVRWIFGGVGIVLMLLDGLWMLQGVGLLAGSVMTSQMFWVIAGPILLMLGSVFCALGLRRRPHTSSG